MQEYVLAKLSVQQLQIVEQHRIIHLLVVWMKLSRCSLRIGFNRSMVDKPADHSRAYSTNGEQIYAFDLESGKGDVLNRLNLSLSIRWRKGRIWK